MTCASHSWLSQGWPKAVKDHESVDGIDHWATMSRPAARCHHRSELRMTWKQSGRVPVSVASSQRAYSVRDRSIDTPRDDSGAGDRELWNLHDEPSPVSRAFVNEFCCNRGISLATKLSLDPSAESLLRQRSP